ncbi:hypothetical protein [Neptuniibacter sp.]|uniref:hypothetical protein n=1 Tax=Neptuniibacter sp. TaxID=1962643 RepID=UPI00261AEE88|nr:hypothetical protein [Neptuniibacter sp.]MCP4598528.1 hypothetical protein [Neptuniibacter sp.]
MNNELHIRAISGGHKRNVGVVIESWDDANGDLFMAEPLVMKKQPRSMAFQPDAPNIILSPTAAQQLIDDLWDCGLRPSEGSGSAGQLAATERHLKDMRTIVFSGECPIPKGATK